MDCIEAMMTRRSVRTYNGKAIPEAILNDIMEAALAAPSAVNLQPWYFVVIQNAEAMQRLTDIMNRVSHALEPALAARFPRHPDVVTDTCRFIAELGGAPACVLAFQYKPSYEQDEITIVESIAAAIENLLLAAQAKGVSSCWMTAPVEAGVAEEMRQAFAPEKGPLVAMITLGYSDVKPAMPRRKEGRYCIL